MFAVRSLWFKPEGCEQAGRATADLSRLYGGDDTALNFSMADDAFETIDVEVKGSKGGSIHANGEDADFDIDEWHQLLAQNKGGQLTFTVCAEKDGQWTQYRDFKVYVSEDPLEAWGITYRRIPPSYEMYSMMVAYRPATRCTA